MATAETYNPKIHSTGTTKSTEVNFQSLVSPIAMEIKDPEAVLKTFKEWPLIPYAGTLTRSTFGLLPFLNALRTMSPTLGACHEAIKSFAFGGKLDITRVEDPDFDIDDQEEEEELEHPVKLRFREFLNGIELGEAKSFSKMAENLYDDLKGNGNYYIELVMTETLGQKKASIHFHRAETCSYWATKKGQPKMIAISPIWDYHYLKDNPPKVLPVYPEILTEAGGTQRTIIHIKTGNFEWYGRPDWIAAWRYAYREFQDVDYLTKMAGNQFTGQVFIEVEDDDIENDEGWDGDDTNNDETIVDKMERNFTVKADNPQTIMITSRPYGSKNAYIYEFKPNTNENFFKASSELARQKIIENNQWSERLLGNAVGNTWAADAFLSELKVKEISVLSQYKNKIAFGINLAINEIINFFGATEFVNLGISFKTLSDKLNDSAGDISAVKTQLDAFGVGVRAGAITPNREDEEYFRNKLSVEPSNEYTDESWEEDGNYRRPITLKGSEDSESEDSRLGKDDFEDDKKEEI